MGWKLNVMLGIVAVGLTTILPLPASAAHYEDLQTFLVYFENDFFAGTDEHYTNAIKLTWLTRDIDRYDDVLPAWSNLATKRLPFARQAPAEDPISHNIGFSLGHTIFTPEEKRVEELIEDDRPYAGWLYGAIALHRKDVRRLDTFELTLGIVGPEAFGEEVQNSVHDALGSNEAEGWDNQLDNELGIMISWQQSRKVLVMGDRGFGFDVIPRFGATLGNVYTYANAGGEVRFGYNLPADFGTALIRPGSTLASPVPVQHEVPSFGIHLFAGVDGRLMLQNIFLDGNTWEDSHSVDKKPLVADLYLGLALRYKRFKLAYTHAYRTKEFDEQDSGQPFGSVSLSYSF